MEKGDYQGAIVAFHQSADLDPHFKTLEMLGACYLAVEEPGKAITPLAAATTLKRQPRAPYLLATALVSCGDLHTAIRVLKRSLEESPNHNRARALLAELEVAYAEDREKRFGE